MKGFRLQKKYSLYLILSVINVVRYIEVCYKVMRKIVYRKIYRRILRKIFIYTI